MGLVLRDFLPDRQVVSCLGCKTHLATPDTLISKEFQGASGRAYLYSWTINVNESKDVEKLLTTGHHVIRDLSCAFCKKKVSTSEASQEYKVGHSILERAFVEDVYNEFSREDADE